MTQTRSLGIPLLLVAATLSPLAGPVEAQVDAGHAFQGGPGPACMGLNRLECP